MFLLLPFLLIINLLALGLVASPALAQITRDQGHVAIIEHDGSEYHDENLDGTVNSGPRETTAEVFYQTHGDHYDFLCVFTNFDYEMRGGEDAFYLSIQNDVLGIGKSFFDNSGLYGSDGELEGYIDMWSLGMQVTDPDDHNFIATLKLLAHEVAHRWTVYPSFIDEFGQVSDDLLGQDQTHWSFLLDSGGSIMYGNDWADNGDGIFTITNVWKEFSPLDLYLMGFYGKEEVPPFFLIDNPEINPERLPDFADIGLTISGTRRDILVEDIIAAEGDRLPPASTSQKTFKMAFILLTAPGADPAPEEIEAVDNVRRAFANYFFFLTKGRGYIDPDLVETDPGPITENPDLDLGLQWLLAQQNPDGSWMDSLITDVRDTGESVSTVRIYEAAPGQVTLGEEWLEGATVATTDCLARRLTSLNNHGNGSGADLEQLLALRNEDGGWGMAPGYQSDPYDTSLALSALAAIQYADAVEVSPSIGYVHASQRFEGGWSDTNDGVSGIASTTGILTALTYYRDYFSLDQTINDGFGWVLGKKLPSGGYGDEAETIYSTAQVLRAFIANGNGEVEDVIQTSDYLFANQSPSGSWRDSSYQTALALQVLRPSLLPNLVVKDEDVSFSPANPKEGQTILISASVRNQGYRAVENVRVRFYDGSWIQISSDQVISQINPGESASAQVDWDTKGHGGDQEIFSVVDPELEIKESFENDNQARRVVTIGSAPSQAELEVDAESINFYPRQILTVPDDVDVSAVVHNWGLTSVSEVDVALFDGNPIGGGVELDRVSLDILSLESSEALFQVSFADTFSHELYIVVDPANEINELDESNNVASKWIHPALMPDLVISQQSFSVFPSDVVFGEEVAIRVLVENRGTFDVSGGTVSFSYADEGVSRLIGVQRIDIPAGAAVPVEEWWRTDFAGDPVEIHVEADPKNEIPEVDETNNLVTGGVTVYPLFEPNLTVSHEDILFTPDPGREGDPLAASALIRNNGYEDASSIVIRFIRENLVDGEQIGSDQIIDYLGPGEEAVVSVEWDGVTERVSELFYVWVDPDDTVEELNENDNSAFRVLDILSLPDFNLSSGNITFDPVFPHADDIVTITAVVANTGEQERDNVQVRAFVGEPGQGDLIGDVNIPLLAGGASEDAVFTWDTTGRSGTFDIYLEVDPDDLIREQREDNNSSSRKIGLQGADVWVSNIYFSPNGDGVQDDTTFSFRLAQVQEGIVVKVVNGDGEEIKDLAADIEFPSPQEGVVTWDGRDNRGRLAEDGKYYFTLLPIGRTEPVVLDNNRLPLLEAVGTEYLEFVDTTQYLPEVESYKFFPDESNFLVMFRFYEDPNNIYDYRKEIWRVSPDGDDAVILVSRDWIGERPIGLGSVSPDSRWISFYTDEGFWIVSRFGGDPILLVSQPENLSNLECKWSPRSEEVACTARIDQDSSEYYSELWKVTLEGVKTTLVTTDLYISVADFIWSPSGSRIAYLNSGWFYIEYWTYLCRLWVIDSEGGDPFLVDENQNDPVFHWSPDENRLAYKYYGWDENDIYLVNLESGERINLTEGWGADYTEPFNLSSLFWDWDRDEIVFFECYGWQCGGVAPAALSTREDEGGEVPFSLIRLDPATGEVRARLAMPSLGSGENVWSPRSGRYLFIEGDSILIDTYTGEWKQFADFGYYYGAEFSPLGMQLVYFAPGSAQKRFDDIWIIRNLQNLTAALKIKSLAGETGFDFSGTAIDLYFEKYNISYSLAGDPKNWSYITSGSERPVRDDIFTSWVPPGPGIYNVRLEAYDLAGNVKVKQRKVYSGITPVITDLTLEPEYFSPNGDGEQDYAVLSYRVLEPCHLEFRIYDEGGNLVATLWKEHDKAQAATLDWNGKNDSGRTAPDGLYSIVWEGIKLYVVLDTIYPEAEITRTGPVYNEEWGGWVAVIETNCSDRNFDSKESLIEFSERGKDEWKFFTEYWNYNWSSSKFEIAFLEDAFVSARRDYRVVARDKAGNMTVRSVMDMPQEVLLLSYQACIPGGLGGFDCGANIECGEICTGDFFTGKLNIHFGHTLVHEVADVFLEYKQSGSETWILGSVEVDGENLIVSWDTSGLIAGEYQIRIVVEDDHGYQYESNSFTLQLKPTDDYNDEFDALEIDDVSYKLCMIPAESTGLEQAQISVGGESVEAASIEQVFIYYRSSSTLPWVSVDATGSSSLFPYYENNKLHTGITSRVETADLNKCEYEIRILLITHSGERYITSSTTVSVCQIILGSSEYSAQGQMKFVIYETFRDPLQNVLFHISKVEEDIETGEIVLSDPITSISVGAFTGESEFLLKYSELGLKKCEVYGFQYTAMQQGGYFFPNERVLSPFQDSLGASCWKSTFGTPCLNLWFDAEILPESLGACNELKDEWEVTVGARSSNPSGEERNIEYIKTTLFNGTQTEIGRVDNPHSGEEYQFTFSTHGFTPGGYLLVTEAKDETGEIVRHKEGITIFAYPPSGQLTAPADGSLVCPVRFEEEVYTEIQGSLGADPYRVGSFRLEYKSEPGGDWKCLLPGACAPQDETCLLNVNGSGEIIESKLDYRWDLTDPEILPGDYTLRFLTADSYLNAGCATIGFTLDHQMELGGVSLNKSFISPANQDGYFDEATITFTIFEDAFAGLKVVNEQGITVLDRTPEYFPEGVQQIVWNGRGGDGLFVIDGNYELILHLQDITCGNQKEAVLSIEVDNTPPVVAVSRPEPNAEVGVVVEVWGTAWDDHFGEYVLEWGIGVEPAEWNPIISSPVHRQGGILGVWENENEVVPGQYALRLVATDLAENYNEVKVPVEVVQMNLISGLSSDPVIFSPNGEKDTTTFFYSLKSQAMASLEVFDNEGDLVIQLVQPEEKVAGDYSIPWNGKNALGEVESDGDYTAKFSATAGAYVEEAEVTVRIDTTPPELILEVPASGSVVKGEKVSVLGTVQDANLLDYLVEYTDNPAGPVWQEVAQGNVPCSSFTFGYLYDLAEGEHAVRLTARDEAGNGSELAQQFIVDNTPPVIALDTPDPGEFLGGVKDTLTVSGVIEEEHFGSYTVRIGAGENPTEWTELIVSDTLPVGGTFIQSNISSIADGFYTVSILAVDEAGWESEARVQVNIDNTDPISIISQPESGDYIKWPVDIIGTAFDVNFDYSLLEVAEERDGVAYRWSVLVRGNKSIENNVLFNWGSLPPDGTYQLRLSVRDMTGTESVAVVPVKVDTRPPSIPTGLQAEVDDEIRSVILDWQENTDQDLTGYNVYRSLGTGEADKLNDGLVSEPRFVDSDVRDGINIYFVTSSDLAGWESGPSDSVTVEVDFTPPQVILSSPMDGARLRDVVEVWGGAYSADDFKEYRLLAGEGIEPLGYETVVVSYLPKVHDLLGVWDTTGLPDEALYTILLQGEDLSGNVAEDRVTVMIDNYPPAPPELISAVAYGPDVDLAWNANNESDLDGYLVYRNGKIANLPGNVIGELSGFLIRDTVYRDAGLPDGEYEFYLTAMDIAGNESLPSNVLTPVVIDTRTPQAAIVSPEDGAVICGPVNIQATCEDLDIQSVLFQYRAGGETAWSDIGTDTALPYYLYWDVQGLIYGDYELRAVATDLTGNTDLSPAVIAVSYQDCIPPSIPVDPTAYVSGDDVLITWLPVSDSDLQGYNIYRRLGDGDYVLLNAAPLPSVEYQDLDIPDGDYVYVVSAIDTSGNESDYSDPAPARIYAPVLYPFDPELVRVAEINLEGGGGNPGSTVRIFKVGILDGETAAGDDGQFAYASVIGEGESTFSAVAVDASGNISRESDSVRVVYDPVPSAPTGLSVVLVGQNNVELDWNSNPESDLDGYTVYRAFESGPAERLNSALVASPTYLDAGVPNGTYRYTVTAVDLTGGESRPSEEAMIWVEVPVPTPPLSLTVSPVPEGSALRLGWQVPESPPALVGYKIYRADHSGGPYQFVGHPDPETNLVYLDENLENGREYFYVVTAFDGINESGPSNEASGIPSDIIPPDAPVILYPTTSGKPITVYQSSINITGTADPDVSVDLYRDDIKVAVTRSLGSEGNSQLYDLPLGYDYNRYIRGVSPDAGSILFIGGYDYYLVYVMEIATGEMTLVSQEEREADYPAWSPDGSRVAFVMYDENWYADIWVADLASGSLTKVTDTPYVTEQKIVWSPDGSTLAFIARTSSYNVYTVGLADGTITQLTDDSDNKYDIAWLSDGDAIVYLSYKYYPYYYYYLNVIDADTGSVVATIDDVHYHFVDPAPTGNYFAFASDTSGTNEIYIWDLDTQTQTVVPSSGNYRMMPQWSPDGKTLAFWEEENWEAKLVYYDIPSGTVIQTGYFWDYPDFFEWTRYGPIWISDGSTRHELRYPPGWFGFEDVALNQGDNLFTAAARDDSGNESEPSDSINIYYDVSGLADLVISEEHLSIYPPVPVGGESVSIGIPVQNSGESPALNVTVSLFEIITGGGLEPVGEPKSVGSIPAAGQAVVTFLWDSTGSPGVNSFLAIADPENQVDEALEDNNSLLFTVQVVQDEAPVLSAETDLVRYSSHSPVDVEVHVLNPGMPRDLIIQARVEDLGGYLVEEVGAAELPGFGYGEEADLVFNWNTADVYPGSYLVRALALGGGEVLSDSTAGFEILPFVQITSLLTTDRISYPAQDTVVLNARIECRDANLVPENITARVEIISPGGEVLDTQTAPVVGLLPGSARDIQFTWPTGFNPPGLYRAELTVTWLEGEEISTSSTTFDIDPTVFISGTVTVTPFEIGLGNTGNVDYLVECRGNTGITGGSIVLEVRDPETGSVPQAVTYPVDLSPGDTASGQWQFDTAGFEYGYYLAVLRVDYPQEGAVVKTVVDTASFEVVDSEAPQLSIESPIEGSVTGAHPILRVRATDNESGVDLVEFRVDGGDWSEASRVSGTAYYGDYEAYLNLGEGVRLAEARAADVQGNDWDTATDDSNPVSITFTVDATPPEITITGVEEGMYYAEPVTPLAVVTDAHPGSVVYLLNGIPVEYAEPVTADGAYTYQVKAWDQGGNYATASTSFVVDQTPPVITVSGVEDGAFYNIDVAPVVEIFDLTLDTVTVTLNGAPFISGSVVSDEGEYTLLVEASDQAGHSVSVSVEFTIDKTDPDISITGVDDGVYYNTDVTPVYAVTELYPDTITASLNDAPFTSGTTITEEGSYELWVMAVDLAGNSARENIRFHIDTTPPLITITGVEDGVFYNSDVVPVVEIADPNPATSTVTLNGAPFISGTAVTGEGVYELLVTAVDLAGNKSSGQVGFTIDKTQPVITITGVEEGAYYNKDVTPVVDIIELYPDSVTVTLNDEPFASGTTVSAEGEHTLAVEVLDLAGNYAQEVTAFVIDKTDPAISIAGVEDGAFYNVPVTPVVDVTESYPDYVTVTLNGAPFTSGTVLAEEGWYVLAVEARDLAGNESSGEIAFSLDLTPPEIVITGVEDGGYYNYDVYPAVEISDVNPVAGTVTLNGDPFVSGSAVTDEGDYLLEVFASDEAGNTASASLTFTIDKTAPAIIIEGVETDAYYNHDVIPVVSVIEANPFYDEATLNGDPFVSGTPVSDEDEYSLYAHAVDLAGNEADITVPFAIDKTPPVITITGVEDGAYYNNDVIPVISVTDAHLDWSTVTLNDEPFTSGTAVSDEGAYTLVAFALDLAGNSVQVGVSFVVDKTPPEIAVSGVEDGRYYNYDVTPEVSIADLNLDAYDITLNGVPFISGTTISAEDEYTLRAWAVDLAANESEEIVWFEIDKTSPEIVVSGVEDGACYPHAVTPVIEVSDADLDPASVVITLNGAPFVSGTAVSDEGSYILEVSALDLAGNPADAAVIFTIDKADPVISISGVSDGAYYNTDVVPVIAVTDANLVSSAVTLNGQPFTSGSVISDEGVYTLTVLAVDCASNTASETVTFTIDKTAPVITVLGVEDGSCYPHAVTPVVEVSEANPGILEVYLNGVPFSSGTEVTGEGEYTLTALAVDLAGNSAFTTVQFVIDLTPPEIVITGVEDGETYTEPVTPVYEVLDPHLAPESVTATLNGEYFASGTVVEDSGDYVLVVSAGDCAGNETTVTVSFTISQSLLPTFNFGICSFGWAEIYNNFEVLSLDPETGLPGDRGWVAAHGDLTLANNAGIHGDAVVGGNLTMMNNSEILGDLYIDGGTVTIEHNAWIHGDTIVLPVPPQPCECGYDLDAVLEKRIYDNDNYILLADPDIAPFIVDGSLVVPKNNSVTLPAGDFYFEDLYVGNNADLVVAAGAEVNLFIGGNVQIVNNADVVNAPENGAALHLVCGTDAEAGEVLYFENNADVQAFVYAPRADVMILNNADLYGAIVGRSFTGINNGDVFLDESLLGDAASPPLTCGE